MAVGVQHSPTLLLQHAEECVLAGSQLLQAGG